MRYSLRSLLVVVTLVCVGLGILSARIECLRRWAVYHEQEALKHQPEIEPTTEVELWRIGVLDARVHHEQLAQKYRFAMLRPWTFVDENQD